jgi:hypothetical protein
LKSSGCKEDIERTSRVPRIVPLAIRPKTLRGRKRIAIVEPDCPSKIILISTGVDRPELAATASEDVLIFVAGLELGSVSYR